ncbi:MAG: hypothetical protein ACRDA3_02435 [Peptostreptococcaceae bacterium]
MRFLKNKNYRNAAIAISIPLLLIAQYYFFKIGIFKPMVKGIEIQMAKGDHIQDIDKFVIKLNEEVTFSTGEYIRIPSYAKRPKIWFKELDDNKILDIKGNSMIGLKEGTSSVGIMKDSRVLKKMNIKVVKQNVKELKANVDKRINYVGESTEIETFVEVDYERFKEKEKVEYSITDESVLEIEGDTVNAIGVGKSAVLVTAGNKTDSIEFDIKAKTASIDIAKNVEIGINKVHKLEPKITTSPSNLKHQVIRYELVDDKLPIRQAIALDKNGTIRGIREGTAIVKITCGNKSTKVNVKVVKEPEIEPNLNLNLKLDYTVVDNKLIVNLEWNYLNGILKYGIYLKNNSLEDADFKQFTTASVEESESNSSKSVKSTIELDLINGQIPNVEIYVVGLTDTGETTKSNIVKIEPEPGIDISKETVENLTYTIDEENNTINLSWKLIDIKNVTYGIYIKDNQNGDGGSTLYQSIVDGTECSIPIKTDTLDIDVYVEGLLNEIKSNKSNIINIKK